MQKRHQKGAEAAPEPEALALGIDEAAEDMLAWSLAEGAPRGVEMRHAEFVAESPSGNGEI